MKFRISAIRKTKSKKPSTSLSKGRSHTDSSSTSSSSSSMESSTAETAKYEYGDDTSRAEYIVISPNDNHYSPSEEIAAKYDYGVAPLAAPSRSSATPRRSSMKHGDGNGRRPRRVSIGYTGEIEVNLPGKRKPVRRRTSISFCEEDQVNEVVPVKSLTDEPEALWFQDEEYSVIKKKMCSLIHTVQRGETSTKKYCIRGLEGHFGEGAECKEVSRETAWDAVLLEQHMQQNEGSFDDESISMMYRLSSIESKIEAVKRATQDKSAIDHYQRDTRRRLRRLSSI